MLCFPLEVSEVTVIEVVVLVGLLTTAVDFVVLFGSPVGTDEFYSQYRNETASKSSL